MSTSVDGGYYIYRVNEEINLPAGLYWIGDPAFAFPTVGDKSDDWDLVLAKTDYFQTCYCDLPNIQIWADHTKYGDERCFDACENEYPIDSGLIGIVPESTIEYLGNDKMWLAQHGLFMTFESPFKVVFDNGYFVFGNSIIIDTCAYAK